MKSIIMAGILVFLAAFSAQAAGSITGEYTTKQQNLTGKLLIQQLPDKRIKFEIYTVKRGGGDYKGSVTTCGADGIAEMNSDRTAVYSFKEDHMEAPLNVLLRFGKNQIAVESNADEIHQCGMGAWIDGKYVKKNGKTPKFSDL